jgi:uncharacterized DUF497 family protein
LKFEWDERKAGINRAKHGVTFEAAKDVFRDPFALTEPDRDEVEERWRIIGLIQTGVLFVVYTERSGGTIRIISARRATRHEQDRYNRQAFPQG